MILIAAGWPAKVPGINCQQSVSHEFISHQHEDFKLWTHACADGFSFARTSQHSVPKHKLVAEVCVRAKRGLSYGKRDLSTEKSPVSPIHIRIAALWGIVRLSVSSSLSIFIVFQINMAQKRPIHSTKETYLLSKSMSSHLWTLCLDPPQLWRLPASPLPHRAHTLPWTSHAEFWRYQKSFSFFGASGPAWAANGSEWWFRNRSGYLCKYTYIYIHIHIYIYM